MSGLKCDSFTTKPAISSGTFSKKFLNAQLSVEILNARKGLQEIETNFEKYFAKIFVTQSLMAESDQANLTKFTSGTTASPTQFHLDVLDVASSKVVKIVARWPNIKTVYLFPLRRTKPSSLFGFSYEVRDNFNSSSTCVTYRTLYSFHHLKHKPV